MENRLLLGLGALGALAAAVLAAGYFFVAAQPPQEVRFGQPIFQDDFVYMVVGVTRTKSIGLDGGAARAAGTFYIATLEVTNKALRVAYRWDPSIVYVVDAAGHKYDFSIDGQRALDARHPADLVVEAGQSERFAVAFDLPVKPDRPALAFSNGIMMGDVFDGAAYLRARVPLD